MKEKERIELIVDIAKRAEELGLLDYSRATLIMDLQFTDEEFNLRLDELLNADNFNFAHDIIGIQRHINRQTKKMDDLFVPRYAG